MEKFNTFNVHIDTDEPVVSVHLDFHTSKIKTLNEAIELLIGVRDKLQTTYTLDDERAD